MDIYPSLVEPAHHGGLGIKPTEIIMQVVFRGSSLTFDHMRALILFFLIVFSQVSIAQDGFWFIAQGGYTSSNFTGDGVDSDNRASFHLTGLAAYELSKTFELESGLSYSQQGADIENSVFKTDVIQLPVSLKWFMADGVSLSLGPQAEYVVQDNNADDFSAIGEDALNELYFSATAGLALELHSGWLLDFSYDYGVTPVLELSDGSNLRSTAFKISLGYRF